MAWYDDAASKTVNAAKTLGTYGASDIPAVKKATAGINGATAAQNVSDQLGAANPVKSHTGLQTAQNAGRVVAGVGTLGASETAAGQKLGSDISKGWDTKVTNNTTTAANQIQKAANNGLDWLQNYINGGGVGAGGTSPYGANAGGLMGTGISAPGAAPTVTGAPGAYTGGQIGAVAAPNVAQLQGLANNPMGAYQNQLAAQLALRASGQGQSLAQMQGNQALAQQQALAASQLASQRGAGNNPFAARSAMQGLQAGQANIQQNTAQNMMAEQQAAQGALGNLATQGRGQDIQVANANAGFQSQANLAQYQGNLQKAVAQGQLDQQTANQMFMEANNNARQNAQLGSTFNGQTIDAQKAAAMAAISGQQLQMQQQQAQAQRLGGLANGLGGLVQGVTSMFGLGGGGGGGQQQVAPAQAPVTNNYWNQGTPGDTMPVNPNGSPQ